MGSLKLYSSKSSLSTYTSFEAALSSVLVSFLFLFLLSLILPLTLPLFLFLFQELRLPSHILLSPQLSCFSSISLSTLFSPNPSSHSHSRRLPCPNMDFSFHSQHFDRVHISGQGDSKPGLLSQPEAPSPFTVSDWARWRSQPAPMRPHQYQGYSFPRVADDEPYGLGPLPQELLGDPNAYIDVYRSHVTPTMTGAPPEVLGPQDVEGHSDWPLLQSSPAFKDQSYNYPQLESLQPPPDSPPSPLSEVSSYHSPHSLAASSPGMTAQTADRLSPRSSTGDNNQERHSHPPYSVLIYQALKEAPGNKLQLQSIYSWFEANTDKGGDPNAKGWQNSIRHNLSMNAVTLTFHTSFFQFLAIRLMQRLLYLISILTWSLGIRGSEGRNWSRQKGSELLEADAGSHPQRWHSINYPLPQTSTPKERCELRPSRGHTSAVGVQGGPRHEDHQITQCEQSTQRAHRSISSAANDRHEP